MVPDRYDTFASPTQHFYGKTEESSPSGHCDSMEEQAPLSTQGGGSIKMSGSKPTTFQNNYYPNDRFQMSGQKNTNSNDKRNSV